MDLIHPRLDLIHSRLISSTIGKISSIIFIVLSGFKKLSDLQYNNLKTTIGTFNLYKYKTSTNTIVHSYTLTDSTTLPCTALTVTLTASIGTLTTSMRRELFMASIGNWHSPGLYKINTLTASACSLTVSVNRPRASKSLSRRF
jgi:hypothetical protein